MPKVDIYLSDELYARAKERALPLSALAQRAVEQALAQSELQSWITLRATGGRADGSRNGQLRQLMPCASDR